MCNNQTKNAKNRRESRFLTRRKLYQVRKSALINPLNFARQNSPLSFAKAHGGSLTMKHQGGAYCVAFKSNTLQAHGWGVSIQKAYENMLQHFEVKNEMYIRKQLLKTIFAPKSNQKTVA